MTIVLITVYNGVKTLQGVLTAYHNLKRTDEEWKLVIVDNWYSNWSRECCNA